MTHTIFFTDILLTWPDEQWALMRADDAGTPWWPAGNPSRDGHLVDLHGEQPGRGERGCSPRWRQGRWSQVTDADLSEVLDLWQIVLSRQAQGGAAPLELRRMTGNLRASVDELDAAVGERTTAYDRAECSLLAAARAVVEEAGGA